MAASSNQVALVTGASSGIGCALAKELAKNGFHVYAGLRRMETCSFDSPNITLLPLDITSEASVRAARDLIQARTGDAGLTALVNNAGQALFGPLELLKIDEIEQQFAANVFGSLRMTQAFLPLLRLRQGTILTINSVSGCVGLPFSGAYAASKFALNALDESLRFEISSTGVRIVSVILGNVRTPIWEKALNKPNDWQTAQPELWNLYAENFQSARSSARHLSKSALSPNLVASRIAKILASTHPKHLYLIGPDARLLYWIKRLLPASVRHFLLKRLLSFSAAMTRDAP